MSSELQDIVDSLGQRLQRAVAVDDTRLRLQAYSPHYGPVDEVRLNSILQREADPASVKYVQSQGIADSAGPVRVAGTADGRLMPRVAIPIRHHELHIGYLWLIDADESLTQQQLDLAGAAAENAGVVMYRERLLVELERSRERELLRDLLSGDAALHERAAAEIVDAELFLPGAPALAVVLRPVHPERAPDEALQHAIDLALTESRRWLPQRQLMHLGRFDHGVVVAAMTPVLQTEQQQLDLGEHLRSALLKHLRDIASGYHVLVGIGETQPSLAKVAASYRQGQQATRVADVVRAVGEVVRWRDLGIYRMLAHIAVEELTTDALHSGLVKLLNDDREGVLLHTLESFLDNAGDVKSTAAALVIHRTSLYYRLAKIEQIAGVDLGNGDDRLAMHLGLKMARMVGLYPQQTAPAPVPYPTGEVPAQPTSVGCRAPSGQRPSKVG